MSESTMRAKALAEQLAGTDPTKLTLAQRDQLVTTLRALVGEVELAELTLEARLEELAALRGLLELMSYPVIEVKPRVLCLPIVGPLDAERMGELTEQVLRTASARRALWLIVDVTGAAIVDVIAVDLLRRLFGGLGLLGIRASLSGVSPALARAMAVQGEPLGVPVHATLATALATLETTGPGPAQP